MNFPRLLLGTWIAACLLASSAGAAWPEKPIKLIVPYPPGGLTDAVARQVGAAPADGYTLYLGNNATVGLNTLVYKKLLFDPIKDLAPVSLVAESQTVLVVHPSVPAKSVAEPGDLLEIEYLDIRPERYGWTRFAPGGGFLPDLRES